MHIIVALRYLFGRYGNRTIASGLWIIVLYLVLHATAGHADSKDQTQEKEQAEKQTKATAAPGGKWLPIPIFLTEPAFGYGLGVSLGYIHPTKDDDQTQTVPSLQTPQSVSTGRSAQKPPPTITGVAAGYTEKDTWAVGGGHRTSWRDDTIRYVGGLAYADVKSAFYISDQPFDFNLLGFAIYQDLKFRLGNSRFFLGGKLLWLETESEFKFTIGQDTDISLSDISSSNVGVAAEVSFDGRDNIFTPNTGQLLELALWRHDEGIGSDYDYWKATFKALSFHQLHSRFVLGLRLETSGVDGLAPFYAYPWVSLRGIPALRYQGKKVAMVEAEGRWNILPRWAVLGFVGTGAVGGDDPGFETQDNIVAGGVGGRWLFMQEQSLWLGVDMARGPEDWYWYITVGHAW